MDSKNMNLEKYSVTELNLLEKVSNNGRGAISRLLGWIVRIIEASNDATSSQEMANSRQAWNDFR